MAKVIQLTIPDKTYEILQQQAEREKLRLATYTVALLRKALEKGEEK